MGCRLGTHPRTWANGFLSSPRRLLREAGGFEGFRLIEESAEPAYQTALAFPQIGDWDVEIDPAPLPRARRRPRVRTT